MIHRDWEVQIYQKVRQPDGTNYWQPTWICLPAHTITDIRTAIIEQGLTDAELRKLKRRLAEVSFTSGDYDE